MDSERRTSPATKVKKNQRGRKGTTRHGRKRRWSARRYKNHGSLRRIWRKQKGRKDHWQQAKKIKRCRTGERKR